MSTMSTVVSTSVEIPAGGASLPGDLAVPSSPRGLVLFAHGSGSGRFSSRNRFVAESLRTGGLATLLFDLLAEEEDRADGRLRFDVDLLIGRLVAAIDWSESRPGLSGLSLGLFGASTGAAAALGAAAERPEVAAIVSRGGRPDLAPDSALLAVRAPTLLIVGGADEVVLALNRRTMARMAGPVALEIVPGATHLFPEPGTLGRVAELARAWFERHAG